MNTKRFVICIVLAIVVSSAFKIGFLSNGCHSYFVNKSHIAKCFDSDKKYLISTKNYLCNVEGDVVIYCSLTFIELTVNGKNFSIDDTGISKELTELQNSGYEVIVKSDNYVSFQKYSDLDSGIGIVYSIDGNRPNLQFLTELEALNEENWYYYEEDFNEWEQSNKGNNIDKGTV